MVPCNHRVTGSGGKKVICGKPSVLFTRESNDYDKNPDLHPGFYSHSTLVGKTVLRARCWDHKVIPILGYTISEEEYITIEVMES